MFSDQPAFCPSQRRTVVDHAQVRGQPESPGVSDALTVAKQQVDVFAPQSLQEWEKGRDFPERKQAGNIRKARSLFMRRPEGDALRVDVPQHQRGEAPVPRAVVRYIQRRNPSSSSKGLGGDRAIEQDSPRAADLDRRRFPGRQLPGVLPAKSQSSFSILMLPISSSPVVLMLSRMASVLRCFGACGRRKSRAMCVPSM